MNGVTAQKVDLEKGASFVKKGQSKTLLKNWQEKTKRLTKGFSAKKYFKKIKTASSSMLDRSGLLSDNRVYFGLILVAGGAIVTIIFAKWLAWIGTLAIILGLGLLIWALLDMGVK